ncbi:MAG: DUF721 domain-containing protein [Actinobacteria bacterium]|nr:DUF721 domain-containing protein [Actinomycetota bacterium]
MDGIQDIGSIIKEVVSGIDSHDMLKSSAIFNHWKEIVGPGIAKRTHPHRLANKVLYVSVANSTWANELSMMSGKLIEKINKYVSSDAVESIRFRANI